MLKKEVEDGRMWMSRGREDEMLKEGGRRRDDGAGRREESEDGGGGREGGRVLKRGTEKTSRRRLFRSFPSISLGTGI